jgi:hypothetical protein
VVYNIPPDAASLVVAPDGHTFALSTGTRVHDHGLWDCAYLLKLADGTILLQGLDPHGPGSSPFAVTGGTGAYRDARGDAVFTDSPTTTDMQISLTS